MRTYTTPSSSSSSIISGIPATVAKFSNYQEELRAALESAAEQAAAEFERRIKTQARGTWGEVASAIQVSVTPELALEIGVAEEYAEEAQALEYGKPGVAPTGVLRMAAVDAPNSLKPRVQQLLNEALK